MRQEEVGGQARALWYVAPGAAELRPVTLGPPAAGQAIVRTLFSALSRGTESLVFYGQVPPGEWGRMRAPLQDGAFPFPVKYGYAAVGLAETGALAGRPVFCLHPHQDRFAAPEAMLAPVPDGVPPRRAVLAANMETALNGVWDAGIGPGDRVAIIGGGVLGALIARLCARLPGAEVTLVDIQSQRAAVAAAMGVAFALPDAAPAGCDVVFHTSATAAGLNTALAAAGAEGAVVELSWYGAKAAAAQLGGAFHSQRLRLLSSQVGQVATSRRPRWSHARRLAKALDLLADPALDALLEPDTPFGDLPARLPDILRPGAPQLCAVISYS